MGVQGETSLKLPRGNLLDVWACTIQYGGRQVGSLPGTLQYIDPYPHLPVRDGTLCRRMHVSAGTESYEGRS